MGQIHRPDDAEAYLTADVREKLRQAPVSDHMKILHKAYPELAVMELECLSVWHDIWESHDAEFLKCVNAIVESGGYAKET